MFELRRVQPLHLRPDGRALLPVLRLPLAVHGLVPRLRHGTAGLRDRRPRQLHRKRQRDRLPHGGGRAALNQRCPGAEFTSLFFSRTLGKPITQHLLHSGAAG